MLSVSRSENQSQSLSANLLQTSASDRAGSGMSARLKSPASKNTLSVTHESPDNGEVPEGALVINEDTERTEDLGRHNRESEGVSEEYVRGDEVRDIPTVASVAKHETQSAKPKSGRSDLDMRKEAGGGGGGGGGYLGGNFIRNRKTIHYQKASNVKGKRQEEEGDEEEEVEISTFEEEGEQEEEEEQPQMQGARRLSEGAEAMEPAGEIPHASSDKDATHPRLELPRANYPPAPYHVPNQKLINATYMPGERSALPNYRGAVKYVRQLAPTRVRNTVVTRTPGRSPSRCGRAALRAQISPLIRFVHQMRQADTPSSSLMACAVSYI
ncbi:hypothetical protein CYMTET_41088 [Cymbomonas tetramitiformis]|uniref:Uncharacterized protein n=1 Tax=Cymbomonas tetramitiformis TaxID=36881 RepID=A0AAE0C848_9CHLO|nr:hypothetical protein CYMTET_41088 [Cymbomonas tetramitiformis]